MRYAMILLLLCLIGCPGVSGPGAPENTEVIEDVVEAEEYKQECRVEWYGCVTTDSYEELAELIEFQLQNNICTADHVLCIYVNYIWEEGPVGKVVKYKTIDDIPRTSVNDEAGNCVIEYLNESL